MAHHIYTTEGFILGSSDQGEANAYLSIFTRELGVVGAAARSVRELKSKLRYALQDFCYSSVSFVKGKNTWKVTSAVPIQNFQHDFAHDPNKLAVCAHALSLIRKLVVGEEKNEALFDIVHSGFEFLKQKELSPQELLNFECIMMLRIVHNLGYLTSVPSLRRFVETPVWNVEILSYMDTHHREAVREINKSIKESQL